jgi:DNA-binding NarL/FixJ family response regulator
MNIKVLFATTDPHSLELLHSLLASATNLICLDVAAESITAPEALIERVATGQDDVVFLDWVMAEAETPALVEALVQHNPQIRTVVLLPLHYRQYREKVWAAGACNSIPKEHMDQEWLSSILCVMYRAMQREQKLRVELACEPVTVGDLTEKAEQVFVNQT